MLVLGRDTETRSRSQLESLAVLGGNQVRTRLEGWPTGGAGCFGHLDSADPRPELDGEAVQRG